MRKEPSNRLRAIRTETIDPPIAQYRGRVIKTTGDGLLVEFSSVVDALRCATEWQRGMDERTAATADADRIEFRIGIHQGDIVVEGDDAATGVEGSMRQCAGSPLTPPILSP